MSGAVEGVDRAKAMLLGDEDTQGIRPQVTFADHSYPAYSKQQMIDFALLYAASRTTPPARSYADDDQVYAKGRQDGYAAGRSHALDDAAKVADDLASIAERGKLHPQPLVTDTNEAWRRVEDACRDIAAAIRLLSQGGKT